MSTDDTYPGGYTAEDIEEMDRFDAFEAGLLEGKTAHVWVVFKPEDSDGIYVFREEPTARAIEARFGQADVIVTEEPVLEHSFLAQLDSPEER